MSSGGGYFVEATYVGNRGEHLIRQPDINRASFDALRANAALPAAQRVSANALRPYTGYSAIRMRISDADVRLQLAAAVCDQAPRRLPVHGVVHARQGDDQRQRQRRQRRAGSGRRSLDYLYGPASFDRRHAFVEHADLSACRGCASAAASSKAIAGGWEISSKFRYQSGQYFTATGNSSIGGRRADYTGAEIDIDGDELRWFNTAAFTNPPDDRRGTATVGQIEGPPFKQMDISMRKNFRFGGRYNADADLRRVQRVQHA